MRLCRRRAAPLQGESGSGIAGIDGLIIRHGSRYRHVRQAMTCVTLKKPAGIVQPL